MGQFFGVINNEQIEEGAEISAEERRKAALLVCSNAESVDDARTLMEMLGLMPGQDTPTAHPAATFGKEFS